MNIYVSNLNIVSSILNIEDLKTITFNYMAYFMRL